VIPFFDDPVPQRVVHRYVEGSNDFGNWLQSGHKRGDGGDHFDSGVYDFFKADLLLTPSLRRFLRKNPFFDGSNCLLI
jgi:hypothetical protein